tara:strand:+ start:2544 stop:3614 length:1071 start_codon:yes stop_codon:yes gene_type:complete
MMLKDILNTLLAIPSPTFHEKDKVNVIKGFLEEHCNADNIIIDDDNLIYHKVVDKNHPTIALVGHSDVVPKHVKPYLKNNHLYGAGASDMQAGLAAFLSVLQQIEDKLAYNIVLIVYAREEGTPLTKNGLASVIRSYPDLMKSIDCAIVGEPTDNTIQLGCLGSCHATITVLGQEAHSARPWNGENALYKALPIIQKLQDYQATKVTVQGLDFQEVMVITECDVSPGRTSIPGHCTFNINYRFGPDKTSEIAFNHIKEVVESCQVIDVTCTLVDSVFAGKIIQSDFQNQLINQINMPIQAKQAWTDVAQLAEAGIPCFNFGPGLQAQAHKDNEYVDLSDCDKYEQLLYKILKKEGD